MYKYSVVFLGLKKFAIGLGHELTSPRFDWLRVVCQWIVQ